MPDLGDTDDEDMPGEGGHSAQPGGVFLPRQKARTRKAPELPGIRPATEDRPALGKAKAGTSGRAESRGTAAAPPSGAPHSEQGRPRDSEDPLVYLVSVCDGIGGAMVALRQYTQRVSGVAVEKEQNLRQFVRETWPEMRSATWIEEVDVDELLQDIRQHYPDVVLLVGGVPCQPFSSLGDDPKGFLDER